MEKNRSKKLGILTTIIISLITLSAASPAQLTIFPQESNTRINSFTTYEVQVQNQGPVKDEYHLSSSSAYVTIAPTNFQLEPSDSKTVHVWYNPSTNVDSGQKTFQINAKSTATGKTYSVTGLVNIIKEHKVDITPVKTQTVCRGEQATFNINITNKGLQKEEFTLETDQGKLSKQKISLENGETQNIELTIKKEKSMKKTFNIIAASTTSYAQDIEKATLNVNTCYKSDLNIKPKKQEVAAFNTAKYQITVNNLGTKQDTFSINTSKGRLSNSTLEIKPNKSKTVELEVTPEKLGTKKVKITAKSNTIATTEAKLKVKNGMAVKTWFEKSKNRVCENKNQKLKIYVKNTGKAAETFKLSTNRGQLLDNKVTLKTGETKKVNLEINTSKYKENTEKKIKVKTRSTTFKKPKITTNSSLIVENCWDLKMDVVPKIQSAGKNKSVTYEIKLKNPGTKENTYQLAYEGPSWISIKPETVEIGPGQKETAFVYAGIPYKEKGKVNIKIKAIGKGNVKKNEEVKLLIGKKLETALKKDKGRLTGMFTAEASEIVEKIKNTGTMTRTIGSIVIGVLITTGILYL